MFDWVWPSRLPWWAWPWKIAAHRVPVERLFQPARSEERHDLQRLALAGRLDRRVVHQGDLVLHPQPRHRALQLQRLVDRLVDERLDRVLAPRAERPRPKASAEPLDPGEADPLDLDGVAVQHLDAALAEDPGHLVLLAGLEVVIAEDRHDRHADAAQLADQDVGLLGQAVVAQVAAEDQDVGMLGDGGEDRLQRALRVLRAVDVANRRQPHRSVRALLNLLHDLSCAWLRAFNLGQLHREQDACAMPRAAAGDLKVQHL